MEKSSSHFIFLWVYFCFHFWVATVLIDGNWLHSSCRLRGRCLRVRTWGTAPRDKWNQYLKKKNSTTPPPWSLFSTTAQSSKKKKEPANLNKIKEYFAQRRFLSVKQLKTKHWRDKLLFKLGQRLVQPGKSNKTELKSLKLGNTRYNSVRFGERRPLNFGRLQAGHRSHGIGIWLIH